MVEKPLERRSPQKTGQAHITPGGRGDHGRSGSHSQQLYAGTEHGGKQPDTEKKNPRHQNRLKERRECARSSHHSTRPARRS